MLSVAISAAVAVAPAKRFASCRVFHMEVRDEHEHLSVTVLRCRPAAHGPCREMGPTHR